MRTVSATTIRRTAAGTESTGNAILIEPLDFTRPLAGTWVELTAVVTATMTRQRADIIETARVFGIIPGPKRQPRVKTLADITTPPTGNVITTRPLVHTTERTVSATSTRTKISQALLVRSLEVFALMQQIREGDMSERAIITTSTVAIG